MDNAGKWTSEFWLGTTAIILSALLTTDLLGSPEQLPYRLVAAAITILASLGYTASRTVVKRERIRKGTE